MDNARLAKQLAFLLEIDKEKNILRQTHLSNFGRQENDAEHAWHAAIMIYLLKEYANEKIDLAKTMMMILTHDIVEIDAGDTFAYDKDGKSTQQEREKKAADRIFGLLPADQRDELRALFEEFEAYETPEARFAHTMDHFQPTILDDANDGIDWIEHNVTKSQIKKRNAKTGFGSEAIWSYMQSMFQRNIDAGHIKDDTGEDSHAGNH